MDRLAGDALPKRIVGYRGLCRCGGRMTNRISARNAIAQEAFVEREQWTLLGQGQREVSGITGLGYGKLTSKVESLKMHTGERP